jgi:Tfp pilus assembly protein PilF
MDSNAILQGWNAIAEFLNCDVRTAKRWETERGLPVRRTRRTPGEGRANVYGIVGELEQWMAAARNGSATAAPIDEEEVNPEAAPISNAAEDTKPPLAVFTPADETKPAARSKTLLWVGVAATGSILATAVVVWGLVSGDGQRGGGKPNVTALSGDAPAGGEAVSGVNARAHPAGVQELYLHGSYLFEQRTPETLEQAKTNFEQAIANDPSYAPAYAALAETYDLLREYAMVPSQRAYSQAKAAALKAIALDPKLPEAHAALGYEEFFWEWNGTAAEKEFKTAIALDSNCGIAHHWYGSMLMHQARFEDALRELNRAQVLEPASAGVMGTRAYALGLSGKRDEAADSLQDILTRVPNSAPLHQILALLSLQPPRDIPRYLDQERRYSELRHDEQELRLLEIARAAYEREGEQAMWRRMLKSEEQLHPKQRTYGMAALEATLGMNDQAIRDLRALKERHDDLMIGMDIDVLLEPLRNDPRFAQLVAAVGLPPTATIAGRGEH